MVSSEQDKTRQNKNPTLASNKASKAKANRQLLAPVRLHNVRVVGGVCVWVWVRVRVSDKNPIISLV